MLLTSTSDSSIGYRKWRSGGRPTQKRNSSLTTCEVCFYAKGGYSVAGRDAPEELDPDGVERLSRSASPSNVLSGIRAATVTCSLWTSTVMFANTVTISSAVLGRTLGGRFFRLRFSKKASSLQGISQLG